MKFISSLALVILFSQIVVSCSSPVNTTVAPILNTQTKEACLIKPKNFDITKDTKPSKILSLVENTQSKLTKKFVEDTLSLDPETEGASIEFAIFPVVYKEKAKTSKTYGYAPMMRIVTTNSVDQARINNAVPKVQTMLYKSMSKDFKFIPKANLEKLTTNKKPL